MDKDEFKRVIKLIDIYNHKEYNELVAQLKHNICQNLRIARKLSHMTSEQAATLLELEPQSLRRIEAEGDRDEFSAKVLIMAIMLYDPDANFYFKDWHENDLLLDEFENKNIFLN